MLGLVVQSCPTLCDSMDCSLQAPLSMGILQTGILEWVAMPSSRGSSQFRNQTGGYCIAGGFFTSWVIRKAPRFGVGRHFWIHGIWVETWWGERGRHMNIGKGTFQAEGIADASVPGMGRSCACLWNRMWNRADTTWGGQGQSLRNLGPGNGQSRSWQGLLSAVRTLGFIISLRNRFPWWLSVESAWFELDLAMPALSLHVKWSNENTGNQGQMTLSLSREIVRCLYKWPVLY